MSDSPTVWYHTFGCKANQYDTEQMRRELEVRGAVTVVDAADAEVAVINTCTVTNQADANARSLIRRLRRERPGLRIVVAGCSSAVREPQYRDMPETDGVIRGHDPVLVADAVADFGIMPTSYEAGTEPPLHTRGTRAWLKVQDGCDRKCSFCATRVARGASVSRASDDIVGEAVRLAEHHPELVITGIHIGQYGLDLATREIRETRGTRKARSRETLATLCERLLETVSARIRLSSIEATEIDDHMVRLMRESGGRLAPHLHVPLQSGSDRVLRMMRRWHTREAYRTRLLKIADQIQPLGLGADVIVGFPGETEADHADTRALIEELPYTYLHVFPYSVRDQTVAASLPDRVPGDVAAERSRELREIALRKGAAHRVSRAGQMADVVVETGGTGGADGPGIGLTGDYLRVEVSGKVTSGDRITASLRLDGDRLVAEPRVLQPPPTA